MPLICVEPLPRTMVLRDTCCRRGHRSVSLTMQAIARWQLAAAERTKGQAERKQCHGRGIRHTPRRLITIFRLVHRGFCEGNDIGRASSIDRKLSIIFALDIGGHASTLRYPNFAARACGYPAAPDCDNIVGHAPLLGIQLLQLGLALASRLWL